MSVLRYTLASEGGSDRALIPIVNWLLFQYFPTIDIQAKWADLGASISPSRELSARIQMSIDLEPCDVLFVHRDSNAAGPEARRREIERAFEKAPAGTDRQPALIPVVPIRMTEAWLLHDEIALRRAANNPGGTLSLQIPPVGRCESLPNPKATLHQLLREASGLSPRRQQKLRVGRCVPRLAELIEDFSPLRQLRGFRKLEEDVRCCAAQS